MAVPKKRGSATRRGMRRSHHARVVPTLIACPRCSQPTPPHVMCRNCGVYNGREVVDVLAKLDKKQRKQKEKELHEHES